jgi:hypothetical protein
VFVDPKAKPGERLLLDVHPLLVGVTDVEFGTSAR